MAKSKNTTTRKHTQLKLTNPKNAGRKAIHERGIRHIKREEITRNTPLHLTVKLNQAHIQNKIILKGLRHAIMRAGFRDSGLFITLWSITISIYTLSVATI
jgi:hypothetical protein